MIDDDFDEEALDAMGDEWLAAHDTGDDDDDSEDDDELADLGEFDPSASADAESNLGASSESDPLAAFGFADEGAADTGGDDLFAATAANLGDNDAQLAWRETYFVLFPADHRPTLTQVEAAVTDSGRSMEIENLRANDDGLFQSVLIHSPEDNAALEISYESGESVIEQSVELAKTLQKTLDADQLALLMRSDARLDVMHFERIEPAGDFEDADPDTIAMTGFDPATLITVVEALAHLTNGLPVDPVAGELLI